MMMSVAPMAEAAFPRALTWVMTKNVSFPDFESKLDIGSGKFLRPPGTSFPLMHAKSLQMYCSAAE